MSLIPQLRLWLPAYPGAKLFIYLAGTSTKVNSYTDDTFTVANTNPVVADASTGLFGPIFLNPAVAYKFVLSPSTDTDPPTNPLFSQDGVSVSSAAVLTVLSETADYTLAATLGDDVLILVDASLAAVTINLYTAVGNTGKKVRVIKIDSTSNAVTVDPSGSQTWNGATTKTLTTQWDAANGASDGANWVQFVPDATPVAGANNILANQVFS